MSVDPVPPSHPVLVCAGSLHTALDRVAALPATYLPAAAKRTALLELTRAAARVEELRLRVLAAGQALGDVAEADGARDAAAWLAHHGRVDVGRARWLTRLATSLKSDTPPCALLWRKAGSTWPRLT
jgi:hypothetical protein